MWRHTIKKFGDLNQIISRIGEIRTVSGITYSQQFKLARDIVEPLFLFTKEVHMLSAERPFTMVTFTQACRTMRRLLTCNRIAERYFLGTLVFEAHDYSIDAEPIGEFTDHSR